MADDKPLPATAHKVKEAREEGDIAHSDDLQRSIICLTVFEALYHFIGATWGFFVDYFQDFIDQVGLLREHASIRDVNVAGWFVAGFGASAILLFVAAGAVVFASWLQTGGPVFKKEPLKFSLESLNPLSYFGKIFSKTTLLDIGANTVSAFLIGLIFYQAIHDIYVTLAYGMKGDIGFLATVVSKALIKALRTVLILLLVVAVVDFVLQKKVHLQKLMMSHQDVKDEHKKLQGNMEMKGHIRQMGSEILNSSKAAAAPPDPLKGANALVVNPTHLAVGLYFSAADQRIPRIRVKAEESEAMALIDHARDHEVPVVRHIWLARTLYGSDEGDAIPYESYKAVAAVYRVLERLAQPPAVE